MISFLTKSFEFEGNGVEIFKILKDEKNVFFLDSSIYEQDFGRYSFIGFDPFDIFSGYGKDSLTKLKEKYHRFFKESKEGFPLSSGLVGFLSYDMGLSLENIILTKKENRSIPHCYFGFYSNIIIIDHREKILHICCSGLPEKYSHFKNEKAKEDIKKIVKKLSVYSQYTNDIGELKILDRYDGLTDLDIKSNFTKQEYYEAVYKALGYIRNGDIYQVNLSQRFGIDLSAYLNSFSPSDLYLTLRKLSPSCFGAYIDCDDFQIISSSPEQFLKLQDRYVQTRPMKGTRPRGTNKDDDRLQKDELLKSKKEIAELLMITDLERNDLGRVCEYGSIKVKDMRTIEEYRTVFQATSSIEGILRRGQDGFDLLNACFPGGSITGCPKIRAMEIIEKLEPVHRSIYTGSLGYISFSGNMNFNIMIRTLLSQKSKIYFHVGGGIVSDSTPENEYNETLVKAKAINDCLKSFFSTTAKRIEKKEVLVAT